MKQISLFLFCCLPFWGISQPISYFRTYGAPTGYDDIRSAVGTPDGGLVFTGLRKSGADVDGDLFLTKVNAAGAVEWSTTYGRTEEDGGNHLLRTSDGGLLVTGHTALSYGEDCDGYIVKTDAEGREQWRALVGTALDDVCDAAVELRDGSFMVVGRVMNSGTRQFDVLLAHLSSRGLQQRFMAIPVNGSSMGVAVALSADGHLLIAGHCDGWQSEGHTTMMAFKCTLTGDVLWTWMGEHPEGTDARALTLLAMPDGGCVVAGGISVPGGARNRMFVERLDASGLPMRSARSVSLPDDRPGFCAQLALSADGNIALAGSVYDAAGVRKPFWALTDPGLSEMKDFQVLEESGDFRTRAMAVLRGGMYALVGDHLNVRTMDTDGFVARVSGRAQRVVQFEDLPHLVFPNPMTDQVYVKAGRQGVAYTFTLTDAVGQQVLRQSFVGNECFVSRGDLRMGIYQYAVRSQDGAVAARGTLVVN